MRRVRVVVVGAGAWGLPAAAELARRGHGVELVDRHGPGNAYGSSSGPTRLWRLSHPDRVRVRLARRAVDAWRRLESRCGEELLLRRGLLWRDAGSNAGLAEALTAESCRSRPSTPLTSDASCPAFGPRPWTRSGRRPQDRFAPTGRSRPSSPR